MVHTAEIMHNEEELTELLQLLAESLHERFPKQFTKDTLILPHHNQGVSNLTFLAQDRLQRMWILRTRFGEGLRFKKERWILKNYQGYFPSAHILDDGLFHTEFQGESISFFLQSYLAYQTATPLNYKEEGSNLLIELGEVAKQINSCGTIGYGKSFIPGQNTFSRLTWSEHIKHTLADLKLDMLAQKGYFSYKQLRAFEKVFLNLDSLKPTPKLYHRDFLKNWSNVLVDGKQKVKAVLDWEHAGSGIGIPEELASALYVLHRDNCAPILKKYELRRLLLGYDISFKTYLTDYKELVDIFVTQIALEKLVQYENVLETKTLFPQWRKNFFTRAQELVKQRFEYYASIKPQYSPSQPKVSPIKRHIYRELKDAA